MSPNHKETKFEIVKNNNDQSIEETSNSHQIQECSKTPSSSSEEEEEKEKLKKKDEEEEDGFRTPTSLDHKISALTCPPPPPKKMKQSLKRKTGSYNNQYFSCRQLPVLDLSKEVQLLFPPTHHIPLSHHSHRAKKIRRADDKEQK